MRNKDLERDNTNINSIKNQQKNLQENFKSILQIKIKPQLKLEDN